MSARACSRANTVRREAAQAFAFRPPSAQRRHVGLDPGLVDEDQPLRVEPGLPGSPALTLTRDVGACLLQGEQCFFLNRSPSRRTNSHTVLCDTLMPRVASASLSRCNV